LCIICTEYCIAWCPGMQILDLSNMSHAALWYVERYFMTCCEHLFAYGKDAVLPSDCDAQLTECMGTCNEVVTCNPGSN
jgi:hypothetical protein